MRKVLTSNILADVGFFRLVTFTHDCINTLYLVPHTYFSQHHILSVVTSRQLSVHCRIPLLYASVPLFGPGVVPLADDRTHFATAKS